MHFFFCRNARANKSLISLEIRLLFAYALGGERGIRTPGNDFSLRQFSKLLVSATHPSLRDDSIAFAIEQLILRVGKSNALGLNCQIFTLLSHPFLQGTCNLFLLEGFDNVAYF